MRKLIYFTSILFLKMILNAQLIEDMAGRKIEIPDKIKKVYSVNPNADIFIYSLAPEKLSGWSIKLSKDRKKYIEKEYRNLPVLGVMYGNSGKANNEEIIKMNPDIILSMSPLINKTMVKNAEIIEKKLKIPVLILSGRLEDLSKTYELMGKILNKEEKAKILGKYCDEIFNEIKKLEKKENKLKVYYARGKDGLISEGKNSIHMEVLRLSGGENAINREETKEMANFSITKEELLLINPDLIIVGGNAGTSDDLYERILKDKNWNILKAVKEKNIYKIPEEPFNCFDRPPSINRLIGLKWLPKILYPDDFNYDLDKEFKRFYKLFYRYDLSEKDLKEILKR